MSHRTKRRWFRRLAVGLAFATFAAPAAAKYDEGGAGSRYVTAGGWSGYVDAETGVPLSAGMGGFESPIVLGEDVKSKAAASQAADPFLTDIHIRQGESLGGPDGDAIAMRNELESRFVQGVTDFPQPVFAYGTPTRPDDAADRFAHSDVAPAASELASSGTAEWNEGLALAIGAIVLALGLGLALGYLSRPRLARTS